jgi:poly(hydroxyalkanoate) granule-associated protein
MLKKARAQAQAGGGESGDEFPQNIKETSRQIWLAGLGAFSRAQAEGMKMFETLVEQGQHLEARTRRAATETAAAAAGAAAQKAKEVQAMAGGTWDKLEQVFEDRVARALSKLGVYTQEDVARLAERVDALSEAVNALIKSGGGAAKGAAAKRPARRAAGTPPHAAPRARKRATARSAATAAPVEAAPKAMPAARVPRKTRKARKSKAA